MIADISTGNTATADVLWLIAAIVFVVAVIVDAYSLRPVGAERRPRPFTGAMVAWIGLALVAIGLLVL